MTPLLRNLPRILPFLSREEPSLNTFLTPVPQAIEELLKRRKDKSLKRAIEEYLSKDIPQHFQKDPILYLARHVATPNFETLRFLHLVEPLGLPAIIGQDTKDRFVAQNQLKRALGKLIICNGISQKNGIYLERCQKVSIIDFNTANGKSFTEVQTSWGENITDFHTSLFTSVCKAPVTIVDDAEWIDRHGRGSLVEHYKHFLSLFVYHGILFEDFTLEDKEEKKFIEQVLEPAFAFVEEKFGCKPLIAQLTPTSVESSEFWMGYPKEILSIVQNKLNTELST